MTYGERFGREDEFGNQTYPGYRPTGPQDGTSGVSGPSWDKDSAGSWDTGSWDTGSTDTWDTGSWRAGPWEQPGRHPVKPNETEPDAARPRGPGRRGLPLWQELPLLLIVAFCLAVLIRTFLLQAFYIPSGSMENTLLVGDRVLVNKVVYDMRDPVRGEVVVFQGTDAWAPENTPDPDIGFFAKLGRTVGDLVGISRPGEKDFIKRVIGLPGDRVSCCDVNGRVFVNGQPLDEPYVTENAPLETPPNAKECRSRRFDEVVVQPGQIFVMGDHRLVSQDSRCQGQVPIDKVIGRAFVIVWPSGRWATLSVPPTFKNVPPPFAAGRDGRVAPDLTRLPGPGAPTGGLVAAALIAPFLPPTGRSRRWPRGRQRRLRA